MNYFYIYGKDQKDYKVAQINLESFKQIKSLKQLNELLINQNLCNFGYISDIKNQDVKIYNGIYKTNKIFFNSDTIKNNINKNLPITAILLIYRKDNNEEPIGYICLENNKLIYISKQEMLQKQFQTTNIANNGALFDVKEAKLPTLKIEGLKYIIGTKIKYNNQEYKIKDKNVLDKDYSIELLNQNGSKNLENVYQDEIISLSEYQEENKQEKINKENQENKSSNLIFLNGHFKELYNKYNGQEVMKKDYIIQVKLAKQGEKYYNKLEDAHYEGKSGEAVLIGTVGEEWTTSLEKVCKKYTLPDESPLETSMIKETPIKIKTIVGKEKVFAFHIKQNKNTTDKYGIKTSWAELTINSSKSEHGDGDWVVSYAKDGQIDENNLAVINGLVFKDTYQKWKEEKNEINEALVLNNEGKEIKSFAEKNNYDFRFTPAHDNFLENYYLSNKKIHVSCFSVREGWGLVKLNNFTNNLDERNYETIYDSSYDKNVGENLPKFLSRVKAYIESGSKEIFDEIDNKENNDNKIKLFISSMDEMTDPKAGACYLFITNYQQSDLDIASVLDKSSHKTKYKLQCIEELQKLGCNNESLTKLKNKLINIG